MKLRYYLRGLGIGMLVAALVLILSGNTGGSMSDEAVKRRAAQLGMVEKNKSVLEDIRETDASADGTAGKSPAPGEAEGAPASGDAEAGPAEGADPAAESGAEGSGPAAGEGAASEDAGSASEADNGSGSSSDMQDGASEPVSDEEQALAREIEQKADEAAKRGEAAAESAAAVKTVTFVVQQGDTSVSVARRAQEMGLVSSAADFDVFLCQNGYDKRISIGSYEIPDGTGQKELADIITRSR